eukprot:c1385_g1_i1.p1 GENE.c1385_g1_i1~~c1385_g1_i1.p1  ORF type:complete len:253 (+),score=45.46 c1385_g1_i1:1-759(+)
MGGLILELPPMLKRVVHLFGLAVRETGQALDRAGCRLQDKFIFEEKISRHRQIMNLFDRHPHLSVDSFVAPSASVIGDVMVADRSSIWYNSVLRADLNSIRIGSYTNIQDRAVILTAKDNPHGLSAAVQIGDYVTIGQGALLHACQIHRESMIGMGAVIGEGCIIEEGAIIGAGAVVPAGTRVPSMEYWAGNPAKYVRKVTKEEKGYITTFAENYYATSLKHREEFLPYSTAYIDLEQLQKRATRLGFSSSS